MNKKKIIAIIPARSASKGLKNKNIKLFNRKPLIQWTIEAAQKSKYIDKIVVSSDSLRIIKLSQKLKIDETQIRPKSISKDTTPMYKVVDYALSKNKEFTHFILLQPTSPLRSFKYINKLIEYAFQSDATSVVSISEVNDHPQLMYKLDANKKIKKFFKSKKIYNRQDFEKIYRINGSIYFSSIKEYEKNKDFVNDHTRGFIMPYYRSIDIDTINDFLIGEEIMKLGKKIK